MRGTLSFISLAALGVVGVACGGEDATERLIEEAIEREGGGDVDIDFGGDGDGSFDLEVDLDGDGEPDDISFDFDEDGSFDIDTGDGSMTMDEDGNFVITDENGEVITGDVDVDGDGIDISSDDGDFSIEGDDGSFTFETDEGEITVQTSSGIPDDWPSDVPEPFGLEVETGSSGNTAGALQWSVIGTSNIGEQWGRSYRESLIDAGFGEVQYATFDGGIQAVFEREGTNVSFVATENAGGPWDVIVTLFVPGS